ncbi:4Fe-4S dicluster domain-containing protein [candidate division KSB1 bacterium]|nr:4Fe-4S dicluster domain-containing protein [candidate division KSB1 bacterium]
MTRRFGVRQDESNSGGSGSTAPKPGIDSNLCNSCQKCVRVCPVDAIEMRNDKAFIIKEKCTNCRACITACPVQAIR